MKTIRNRWLKPRSTSRVPQRASASAQILVGRIQQRYGLRRASRRDASLEYLQPRQDAPLPKAVSLALSLVRRITQANSSEFAAPAASGPQITAGHVLSSPGAIRSQAVERILLSHQRLELVSGEAPISNAIQTRDSSIDLPPARPSALIVRQNPPAADGGSAANRPLEAQVADRRTNRSPAGSAAASSGSAVELGSTVLPPAELHRVTEQVIQEIDRRIIANRERFGRS